ncbi:MAG TPA: hypothetical protein VMZ69_00425, partial [Saprospiraceae bacterium]|nr:hypothetical protein [Saprospiraceae bacterium]
MTSVLSHRQRLNGSRIAIFFLIGLLIACSTTKSGSKKPADPQPKTEDKDDKVRVYDPATGTYILVPRDAVKVDTVKWTEDKSDPVLKDKDAVTDSPTKKSSYEVSLLIPLNADNYTDMGEYMDPKLIRFLQYYGGMRIAATEIENMGLPVTFHSFDTELSMTQIAEVLKNPDVRKADVLVGPYEKENLESVAAFGLQNEKFVVSPWLPAFNIDSENPFFIQVVPGLNTHAE